MGAGIAEVFARNGFSVIGVEVNDEAVQRGREHLEHSTDRAVKRGKMTEDEQAELLGRISFTTSLKDLTDADFVVEAVVESLDDQEGHLPPARRDRGARGDPRDQHLLAVGHRDLDRQLPARPRDRRPLLQPGAGAEPGRDRPHRGDRGAGARTTSSRWCDTLGKNPVVCGDKAGFIANTLLFGYLNHAVSMYEHRYATREDIDAAMRFGCGYPMGPLALLDLIGLDTAYEILDTMYKQGRDRLHAPAPLLKQYVTAGLLGRKSGRGFYTYEGPDSPVVVDDAVTPSADDKPQLHHDIKQVGVVGTGTMASGIVEVFAKAGYDVLFVGRSQDKVAGVVATITKNFDKQIQRGKATEEAKAEVLALVQGTTSLDDLGGRRHRGRGHRRGPRHQDHALREPRRDLQARRDPGDDHVQPPDHLDGQGDQAAAGRHRHALLQPGHDHEAGRGGVDGDDRRARSPRPPAPCARRSARSRSPAATGPGSSSTRCCSPTSTTR